MPTSSITKPTTVQLFMKDRTDLRLEAAAVDLFITSIDQLADAVVTKAAAIAKGEGRTTLLDRDVAAGFAAAVPTPGQAVDPDAIFQALDQLDTDQLAKVINLIQAWLDHQK
jgi:hypothetical protein